MTGVTSTTADGTSAPTAARLAESVVVGAAGAAVGRVVGGLIDPSVGWIAAGIGGANGLLSGWRQIYSWRNRDGWLAFVLDSTWGSDHRRRRRCWPTACAVVTRAAHNEASLSTRQNRHVYRRGAQLKPGYTLTVGNVISGAGDVDKPRRRRLITDHEGVHVWQARWFGRIYPVVYAAVGHRWLVGRHRRCGCAAGDQSRSARSSNRSRTTRTRSSGGRTAATHHWPPSGAVGVGWKKPAARPLADVRAERPAPDTPANRPDQSVSERCQTVRMTYQYVLVSADGPITTITLDRPEKRNALALDVMIELTAAFREVGATRGARRGARRQRPGVLGRPQLRRHGRCVAERRPADCSRCAPR